MKFGPELPQRLNAARERKRLIAAEGEGYLHMAGEYRLPFYQGDNIPKQPELDKVYGVERQLYFSALQLSQVNRERGIDRPTIMLDVGGMVGLSMVRIAAQPDMRQKIEQGKVVIVVSNLGFDMKGEFTKLAHQRLEFLSPAEALYISSQRYLVQYVQGDAAQLLRTSVTTPDGRTIPLRGNVDVVHERLALAHGLKNDLDIPRLGKLVSPTGELWLGTTADDMMSRFDLRSDHDTALIPARQAAHTLGVENLTELQLQPKSQPEPSSYQIFRHAKA